MGLALGPVSGLVHIDAGERLLQSMSGGNLPTTLEFFRVDAGGNRVGASRGLPHCAPYQLQPATWRFDCRFQKTRETREKRGFLAEHASRGYSVATRTRGA